MNSELNNENRKYYNTFSEIEKEQVHYFSENTMRYFNSRVDKRLYYGCLFIMSDRMRHFNGSWDDRFYAIREVNNGIINTLSKYGQYKTKAQAITALHKYAHEQGYTDVSTPYGKKCQADIEHYEREKALEKKQRQKRKEQKQLEQERQAKRREELQEKKIKEQSLFSQVLAILEEKNFS